MKGRESSSGRGLGSGAGGSLEECGQSWGGEAVGERASEGRNLSVGGTTEGKGGSEAHSTTSVCSTQLDEALTWPGIFIHLSIAHCFFLRQPT